jgi:hypothetical protein
MDVTLEQVPCESPSASEKGSHFLIGLLIEFGEEKNTNISRRKDQVTKSHFFINSKMQKHMGRWEDLRWLADIADACHKNHMCLIRPNEA